MHSYRSFASVTHLFSCRCESPCQICRKDVFTAFPKGGLHFPCPLKADKTILQKAKHLGQRKRCGVGGWGVRWCGEGQVSVVISHKTHSASACGKIRWRRGNFAAIFPQMNPSSCRGVERAPLLSSPTFGCARKLEWAKSPWDFIQSQFMGKGMDSPGEVKDGQGTSTVTIG